MIHFKKALAIVVILAVTFSGYVIPKPKAYANPNTSAPELTLGDFESADETWDFLIGSGGALGDRQFSRDSANAQSGLSSGKLQLDFSSGSAYTNSYVTLEKYFFKRVLPTDAVELSFWVKTEDMAKFDLILLDSSNQNHQQTIILQPTTDWQKVTVSSFTTGTNYTKWGGKNDGIWYGPLKKMQLKLTKASMKTGKTIGAMWIDDIRAKVTVPDLAIVQTQVGNVFAGSQAGTFDMLTTGDEIRWSAVNAWGELVSSGSDPVTGGKLRLTVPVPEDGYYRLKAEAFSAGSLIRSAETTFATLPEFDLSAVADSPFGIQTHYGINWNKEMIPLIKHAGTKNVRDSFYWSEVEINKGQYSFIPKVTLPMQAFKEFSIHPLLTFAFSNKHYDGGQTPYTEEAHIAYVNYVKAMMGKFGSEIQAGEIWNEFNLPFFGGNGPAASRADIYFNMLKKAYEASKVIRPDFNVVGGSTSSVPLEWLEDVFELGGLDYMDTLSVHPYRFPQSPEGLLEEIEALNQLVRDHNDGETIPLWFTEIGWPTHLNPTGVDENTQAAYLIRTYVLSMAAGIEKVFWYNLMDTGTDKLYNEHNFGIIHNSGDALGAYTPKPGYVALATLTRQLTNATPISQSAEDGVYHYTFDKSNQKINVLWSLGRKEIILNTENPLAVTDMMGRKSIYTPLHGKVYLTLTGEPLFIQGDIDSIVQESPFTLLSSPAYTGDPITLTLQVNHLEEGEVFTAKVSLLGESQDIFVDAAGDYSVQFSGVDRVGSVHATAVVYVNGATIATLSETVEIRQAEMVSSKHVVKNGADVMEISFDNERPTERRLTQIDWNIGTATGTEVYDVSIPGNSIYTVDIPLSGIPEGALQAYQFELHMEDGAILRTEGTVKLVPMSQRVLLPFRTLTGMEDVQDLPGIDLISDGNNRIGSHSGPEDFSGKLWSTYDADNLYMYARIHDDLFSQSKTGEEIWSGDSIQFAVSAGMPGEQMQWHEIGMALTTQGPELYRWMAPQGFETGPIANPNLQVTRDEEAKDTIYQLALPWSELAPIVPSDQILSLSIVFNENDGNGRKGYVEWGSGIGASKQSSLFKPMLLEEPNESSPGLDVPGKPILSDNHGQANGLRDGNYTIWMNMWWGENGKVYKLYENGALVHTETLQSDSPNAQTSAFQVKGKSNGSYSYTCELINDMGTTACDPHNVIVSDASPGKPELSNDNWDGDGTYAVTMNMWWGTNATEYRLYENGQLIETNALTAVTPNAQTFTSLIKDRAPGVYEYRGVLANAAGVTESAMMSVKVAEYRLGGEDRV